MAPDDPGGPFQFSGSFIVAGDSRDIGGDQSVTVAAAATGGNGDNGNGETGASIKLSSQDPGAAVQITLEGTAATGIQPNQDITISLPGFGMPETIADSAISITSAGFKGSPTGVLVTGSTITMTVPQVRANGDPQTMAVSGAYSIRVKQAAGISNPASGGAKTITLQENAPEGAKKEFAATINRVVKLSKTSGTRGTMITATFNGFADGTTTVFLNGRTADEKLGEVTVTDNTGEMVDIDTTPAKFLRGKNNTIYARDADGNWQDKVGTFAITPKVEVDPEETAVSKTVKVKLSDWPAGQITNIQLGGEKYVLLDADDNAVPYPTIPETGKYEFDLNVASDANRGTQTVKITQGAVSATADLEIGVLALTIQPAMVVPGQQITIQGSGFVSGDEIKSVKIGNQTAPVENVTANSAGNIVIAVNVPSSESTAGIGSGKKTVSVTASGIRANGQANSGRVAEGSIEISKATIILNPETSRRGTTVNVSGSGFPSSDLVQIRYDNDGTLRVVAAGSADASGTVSIDFTVPSYARIGSKHNIEANSVGVFKSVTAKATHETPGAMVTLSTDRTPSGQNITISGMNFPAFAAVAEMTIGGVDVRPVPAPATSINGDFESTILVPQLELGNQTVSVKVGDTTITTHLEIGTADAPSDPADVFGGLGDRLVRVWYLDRATQQWSFYDPDPEVAAFNTLTEASSGQIVTIIVSEGDSVEFQGGTVFAGSNPVSLN